MDEGVAFPATVAEKLPVFCFEWERAPRHELGMASFDQVDLLKQKLRAAAEAHGCHWGL